MVTQVDFLVEEQSMEEALRLIVPKIVGDLDFNIYRYECKQDLLAKLPARLRGYAAWRPEGLLVVVVLDRDADDCISLKAQLEEMASRARLRTRLRAGDGLFHVVFRLAIEELEAWFFGDWGAVQRAYPRVNASIPAQSRYRDPDAIAGGTWEALERILQAAGYFKSGLRKIEAARSIARAMEPEMNRSRSFQAFRNALSGLAQGVERQEG